MSKEGVDAGPAIGSDSDTVADRRTPGGGGGGGPRGFVRQVIEAVEWLDDDGGPSMAMDFDTLARVMARLPSGPRIGPDCGIRDLRPEVWANFLTVVGLADRPPCAAAVVEMTLLPSPQIEFLGWLDSLPAQSFFLKDGLLELIDTRLHMAQGATQLVSDVSGGRVYSSKVQLQVFCWRGMDWLVPVTVKLTQIESGAWTLKPLPGEMEASAFRAAEIAAQETRVALARHGAGNVPVYLGAP